MKRRLPVIIALILAPVIAALMLRATRERDRLVPAQDSQAPEWLQCDGADCELWHYTDRQGRGWWRFNPPPGGTVRISIPAESFADGCEVAWFVRRGSPLLLRPAAGADPLPGPARNRVRPGKILFHRLTREALCDGAVIELADAPRLESLFLSFADAHVGRTEAGYVLAPAILGARGRSAFIAVSAAFLLLAVALALRYRRTGSAAAGVAALAAAFALGAFWFDSPVWSRELRLDKGDDSFYLAYAQNLVNHGSFFRAPTAISFGARNLDHCHGLPGIAMMLSPPLAARALPGGAPLRGNPVSAPDLSVIYTMTKCEIRVTNRGDEPGALATAVDGIATDLICCMSRELSFKLSDDGKTYTVTFNLEDVPGMSRKEFEDELREMAEDETDSAIYAYSIS